MEKAEWRAERINLETGESQDEGITSLLKILSKPDAILIFRHTVDGIKNSTYAIENLGLTPKRYYARLKELVDIGLVRKKDSVYGHTGLGSMIYNRLLPAFGKAVEAREELEFLVGLGEMDKGVRKLIEEKLGIPVFTESTNVKVLGDYEALVIEVIDLYDSAEESVLLASNYWDVRVMEALFRATERGITNRLIVGKKSLSSKLQQLRMMLSVTFAKTIINFASNKVNLKGFARFIDLPYAFCIVDGHHSIIDISNTLKDSFIVALSIDDRSVGEKLTKFYETLWKAGEFNSTHKVVTSIGNKLNGEAPQQDSDL